MSEGSASTTAPTREISQKAHEFGVAAVVLGEHPGTLTEVELTRRICRGRPEEAGDDHEAIQELIGGGVLHREGERIHASEAAVTLARVWDIP